MALATRPASLVWLLTVSVVIARSRTLRRPPVAVAPVATAAIRSRLAAIPSPPRAGVSYIVQRGDIPIHQAGIDGSIKLVAGADRDGPAGEATSGPRA